MGKKTQIPPIKSNTKPGRNYLNIKNWKLIEIVVWGGTTLICGLGQILEADGRRIAKGEFPF